MAKKYEMTVKEYDKILAEYMKRGVLYAKGGQLEELTKSNLDSKKRQTHLSNWYNSTAKLDSSKTNYQYLLQFCDKGYYMADCCGLIKGIRMGNRVGKPHVYVGSMDETIEQMRDSMVKSTVTNDPYKAKHGYLMVAKDCGHVAMVYEEGVSDVESAMSTNGVKVVPISYQVKDAKSYWTMSGALPWIDYRDSEKIEVGDKVEMEVYEIKDGYAYGKVKLPEESGSSSGSSDNTIKVGSKVTIHKGAKSGGENEKYKGLVIDPKYANDKYVDEVTEISTKRNEARLKNIVTWVNLNDLSLA